MKEMVFLELEEKMVELRKVKKEQVKIEEKFNANIEKIELLSMTIAELSSELIK